MNHGPLVFLGLLASVVLSWAAVVMVPQFQVGDQGMVRIEETGQDYPQALSGQARRGAEVYRANGCQYCHTQQVRDAGEGYDLARGWGARRTVARDYVREQPAMIGSVRFGPDLTNLGIREHDRVKLLQRLYHPRWVMPGSPMPQYPYLFEVRKLAAGRPPSVDALPLPEGEGPGDEFEVVPTPDAEALVAYLLSLRADPLFFEVFPPPAPKAATNAEPAAVTETNVPPSP